MLSVSTKLKKDNATEIYAGSIVSVLGTRDSQLEEVEFDLD